MLRSIILASALLAPSLAFGQDAPRTARGADVSRDAFMSRAELAAARRFARLDADGDGIVTSAERAAARAAAADRRAARLAGN